MRIRRVTYDLGNVIERQEYLDGRYGAPGEKRAGGSGAGQPVDQGEESQTQAPDVF